MMFECGGPAGVEKEIILQDAFVVDLDTIDQARAKAHHAVAEVVCQHLRHRLPDETCDALNGDVLVAGIGLGIVVHMQYPFVVIIHDKNPK